MTNQHWKNSVIVNNWISEKPDTEKGKGHYNTKHSSFWDFLHFHFLWHSTLVLAGEEGIVL